MKLENLFLLAVFTTAVACSNGQTLAPEEPAAPALPAATTTPSSALPAPTMPAAMAAMAAMNGSNPTPTTAPASVTPAASNAAGAPAVPMNMPMEALPTASAGNPAPAPVGPPGVRLDPATGELVFRTEPIAMEPGEESYTCFGATLEEDVVVDGFSKSSQPFVHHAQFVQAILPEPEGVSVCKEQFKLTWLPIFLAGNGPSELRFDEGVGHVLGAGTQLVLQMHLFNVSDKKQTQAMEIRMHRSKAANPTPVSPWAIGSSQIHLPARQTGKAQNVCQMTGPSELLAVFPHMHTLGKRMLIEIGKDMSSMKTLYSRDPFNFDDQRMEKVNIKLEAGDLLRVTCDYLANPNDTEVTFGESSTEEMCFFVGFVKDGGGQADCPNLWDALLTL
ncbi:MAG TPA: hypothetical protein VJV78_13165 [Polyangiales bacterium]|nr:hypothetical protein [Polyangiales bacterium]